MRMPRPGRAFKRDTPAIWRPAHGPLEAPDIRIGAGCRFRTETVLDLADSNTVSHLQPGSGYHQTDVVQKPRFRGSTPQ